MDFFLRNDFSFFFLKIDNITMDPDLDPNWAKILDPQIQCTAFGSTTLILNMPKKSACRDPDCVCVIGARAGEAPGPGIL